MGQQTTAIRPPDQVSREIESTRRRIEERADALRDRMSPRELIRPLTDRLKDTLGEGGEKILDVFRENPIPLTLVGVGLGWLLLKDTRPSRPMESGMRASDVASRAKEAAHQVGEAASSAASAVSEKVGGMSEKVGTMAHRATEAAKKGATSTADWFTTTLDQNPLALAVGALALGMVAGIVIPATEKEEELVGTLGEKAAETALEKSTEAVQPPAEAPAPEPQQAVAPQEGRADIEAEGGMGQ